VIVAVYEIPAVDGRFVKNLAVRHLLAERTDVLTHYFVRGVAILSPTSCHAESGVAKDYGEKCNQSINIPTFFLT
jgi:hypothetical protein